MKRLILVALSALLVTGGWGVANAQAEGNVYFNKFVGLSFSVPKGWHIVTDNEMKDFVPDAARVTGLDKAMMAQISSKSLLIVSRPHFGGYIVFMAVNVRDTENEAGLVAKSLSRSAREMIKIQPSATASRVVVDFFGGE